MTTARENALLFQKDFSAAELAARRTRLMTAMKGGIAVVQGTPEVGGFDPFRQTNDFYYLTGVEVPHGYLVLNAATGKSTLYLAPRNEKHEKTDGPVLCADDGEFVRARTAIEEVKPLASLPEDLKGQSLVYLLRAHAEGYRQCQDTLRFQQKCIDEDPLNGRPSPEVHLLARIAQLSPAAEFRDLSPALQLQRLIKSPAEVDVMRRCGKLTAEALVQAMRATRPGVFEYQLGAVADYVYLASGAQGAGYRAIIAGGANIWMMHYWRNNTQLKSGDLVIFDYAPDLNNYTSDIGRMWPVNGTYSPLQRELYGFVIEHHKMLLSLCKPGRIPEEILSEAAERMRPVVEKWKWSKPIYKAAALKLLESQRPLSHGVGMAVHEPARYFGRPLEPGLVFTIDPEFVVPEEQLYIRVEDTVVVTETGIENFTADAPLELDEVEKVMREPGVLQAFPPTMLNPGR